MKLFNRKPKPKPVTGNLYNSATAVMPIPATAVIPVAPTIKTLTPQDVQFCASCGEVGATHRHRSGDFYLGPIFYFLCNACYELRIEKHMQHVFSQRKEYPPTDVRIVAVNAAKAKGGIVQQAGWAMVGEPGPNVHVHVKIDDCEINPTMILPVTKKEPA